MGTLGIELLGRFRITFAGQLVSTVNTSRLQALVAWLVLHSDAVQSRRHLAFLFWPDSTESQARTNLRQLLYHLRSALPEGGQFLDLDTRSLRWRAEAPITCDVAQFESAILRGDEAERRGDSGVARQALDEAARLYRGDLLPGLYDEWLESDRERLRQKQAGVLERLVSMLEREGDIPGAIRYAERIVTQDPLREPGYQTLMRLHVLNRDRAGALRVYHQCVTVLQRELNVEPGPETQKTRERVMALDAAPARSVARTPLGPFAGQLPLVGRSREWSRMLETWRAASQGRAILLLVTGEPGIGKTRLAEELLAWAGRQGASAARTRCFPAEGSLAFAPVADWLRSEAVGAALAGLSEAQLFELARIIPEVLVGRPDAARPREYGESWQRRPFFEALALAVTKARQPLLLVIDDIHWCDRNTLEWLHFLIRFDPAARLLVVATCRLDEVGPSHPLTGLLRELRRQDQAAEIALGALDGDQTASLATRVAGRELGAEYLARLFQETEGNPLFVVESVRAGLVAAPEPFGAGSLPPKVHAVLSGRLAQLSDDAREVVGLAATIGHTFTFDLLAKAGAREPESLVGPLDELWQRRIIQANGDSAYDFAHEKLREVAYGELGPARRRLLHRRVAEALEAAPAFDRHSANSHAAAHYERAGLPKRAIPHHHRAAVAAQRLCADREAIGHVKRALELLESLPQSQERDEQELDLLVTLGPSVAATEGYATPKTGRVYARARLLCECTPAVEPYLRVLWGSWTYHVVRADLSAAKELGARLQRMAASQQDATLAAAGDLALASALFHLGEFAPALGHLEQAKARCDLRVPPFESHQLGPDLGVFTSSYLSQLFWIRGDAERSAEESRRAIALARELSHPFSLALALDYAALLEQLRGESPAAQERAEEAAELCRKYGFRYYLAWTPIIRGWVMVERKASESGLEQIQEGLAELKALGAGVREPYFQALLAQALGILGRAEEGLKCLADAFAVRNKSKEAWADAELYRIKGDLLAARNSIDDAAANYRRAAVLARQQGAASFEWRADARLSQMSRIGPRTKFAS